MSSSEQKFLVALRNKFESKKTRNIYPREQYNELLAKIKLLESSEKKSTTDYYNLKRYDIFIIGGYERLITKVKETYEANFKIYVYMEELYGILEKAHKETGHGGRDRMIKHINNGYANISRESIELFTSLCENCNMKKKHIAKGVVVKPILSKEFNSRGQVDLMDFQSNSDGNYKFLMVYQDHLTTFCNIRALTSKHASEVAFNLIEVFTLFGAPHILQSDNGREFTALVISELKLMWPELVIVHGKPRHPQSQGSVERSNGDIHDMLTAWMRDNE